jgi:DHA2 family multidrug resistance protein
MLGILAVLLGASLATLFGRLLNVGLPDLRGALHLDFDSASWIGTSYNMSLMFVGPFSVYLGGVLGVRRVLLASGVIFTATCIAMPFAGHLSILIALLVIAGVTSGTFYPLTLSFILRNLPTKFVPYGIGAYAFDIVVTTHLAHSYEGWLVKVLSWHWIFWTTAVLTPVMILLVHFGMPRQPLPHPKPGQPAPSWRGFLYASFGFALLYGALDQGQRLNWWLSGTFAALFIVGIGLILATVVRRLLQPNPLVNFPFVLRRNVLLLAATLTGFRFVLLSAVVLVPSFLASISGYRPEQTGSVLQWIAIPQILAGVFAIYLLGKIDARLILAAGFSLIAVACILDARITSVWSGSTFTFSQLILAIGEGLALNGLVGSIILELLNSGAMNDPASVLSFAGFFQTVRLLGGESGVAFTQFFLHHRQIYHFDQLAMYVQGGGRLLLERQHLLVAAVQAQSPTQDFVAGRAAYLLGADIQRQAFTLSIADAFLLTAYVATACLVVTVLRRPVKLGLPQIVASSVQPGTAQQEHS